MRTLIVTGGTGGVGSVVVERLARDYRCVLLARHATASANATAIQADLTSESSVREAMAAAVGRFGAPYGVVHLAGGFAGGSVAETSLETWQRMLALNLTSSFLVFREALAHMRRDQAGRIVAVSSIASVTRSGAAAYTVAKSGLNTLVELTARELANSAITVNALVPATLDTPASRAAIPDAKRIPLEEVAETLAFLLSDAAGSINGALLRMG